MSNERVLEMAKGLRNGVLNFGPDLSRLLIRTLRQLAKGNPLTSRQVDDIIADLGIPQNGAHRFLREVAERDPADSIIGIMGLSLASHPHRLYVDGKCMSAWCAEDTLFLPTLLKQMASIESSSPVSKERIRLTVSPERVEEVSPADAAVSIVIMDTDKLDIKSVESIWTTFCHHVHFFASRKEAEQWAGGRDDIEILSVEEAFEFGKRLVSKLLHYDTAKQSS